MKKLFFDTEFTGLIRNTELISIGIIDEDGRSFYAEINDYDNSLITPWIQENVIDNLILGDGFTVIRTPMYFSLNGSKEEISKSLNNWLSEYDKVEFISDCNSYDHVLLVDLITNGGSALDMPEFISPYCHDINQDIAIYYNVSNEEAFNMSREKIANTNADGKHNALKDAVDIKKIYEMIHGGK